MPTQIISAAAAAPVDLQEVRLNRRLTETTQDADLWQEVLSATEQVEAITRRQLMVTKRRMVLDHFPAPFGAFSTVYYPYLMPTSLPTEIYRHAIELPFPPLVQLLSITYIDVNGATQTLSPTTDVIVDAITEPARISPAYATSWPITRHQTNAVTIDYLCGFATPMTIDPATDLITPTGVSKTYAAGDVIRFSNSGGVLPTNLSEYTDYYVLTPSGGSFQISLTLNGAAIDIKDTGDGTNYIGAVPAAIKRWISLRAGTKFENREEVAVLNRGKVELLPYVDGLLDPWRVISL